MALSAGKERRLGRLIDPDDGKAMIVAADHGMGGDPTINVVHFRSIIPKVLAGKPDGLLINYGQVLRLGSLISGRDAPALIVRADRFNALRLGTASEENALPVSKLRHEAAVSAEVCLKVGASAICTFYLVGYDDENELRSLESCAVFAQECRRIGLPLIIEVMPLGQMVSGTRIVDLMINSCRIAVELGADALKAQYTGDVDTCREMVGVCGEVPVFLLGGAKSDNPRDSLEVLLEGLEAGAAGVIFGRNVLKSKDPECAVKEMMALVHQRKTIDELTSFETKGRVEIGIAQDKCSGCRICESVCAFRHTGSYSPHQAVIRVERKPMEMALKQNIHKVAVCDQCGKCVEVCPAEALELPRNTGGVHLKREECTGCGDCADACPLGVIMFDGTESFPLVCDFCQGEPQCIKWCPTEALHMKEQELAL